MILSKQGLRIVSGGNADIFIDAPNKVAYKIFKSFHHLDIGDSGEKPFGEETFSNYKREVFQTEFDAYELVQRSEFLKRFTPIFHGREVLEGVTGETGDDESRFYLLDCCLKLEFVDGDDLKLNEGAKQSPAGLRILSDEGVSIEQLEAEFAKTEIFYLLDASVITNETELKFIDFATHEVKSPDLPPQGTENDPYSEIDLDRF